jgi:hypothetical protein
VRSLAALLLITTLLAAASRAVKMQIRIPVWTDSSAKLTTNDLTVKLDGAPARILRMQGPGDDLMLLLVLDLVGDLAEIDLARDALISSINQLPPNAFVGLLRAQDGLRVLLDPTPDRDAVADAIQALNVSGRPGLLETAETAADLADSILAKAPVRIALCYVTDSNIYEYREDFTNPVINTSDHRDLSRRFPEGLVREKITKLADKLSFRQTPLFIVHLDYRTDRLNEAYQNGLLQLASTTGGTALFCHSNAEIPSAVERIFQMIQSHYSLDIQVPQQTGANVQISLEGGPGSLSYRTRYQLKGR